MRQNTLIKAACIMLAVVMLLPMLASCSPSLKDPEPNVLKAISFTAQKADESGVAYDSGFLITSDLSLSQKELKKYLTVDPAFEFDLSKTDDGFILKPTEPLLQNTVYGFTLGSADGRTRTWAFQTRRLFGIVSAMPRDGAVEVNSYSGIEIVTSHYGVDLTNSFEITPPVNGSFNTYGYTTNFYPNEGYQPNTKYTVTVKKGLESPFGDILPEDYSFSFTTAEFEGSYGKGERPVYLYGEYSETFLSTDTPLIELGVPESAQQQNFTTAIYQFSGSDKYIAAINARDAYINEGKSTEGFAYPADSLKHLVSFDSKVYLSGGDNTGKGYIILDKPLPKGWYMVNINTSGSDGKAYSIQKLLQVSDVAVYSQSANGETLVWLNDAANGQPINAAGVGLLESGKVNPTVTGTTDKSGIAILSTGALKGGYLFAKVDADNEFVDKISLAQQKEPQTKELYYSFLYKDRELYLPTDTINFWGRIAPRKDGVTMPKSLKAKMTSGYGYDAEDDTNAVQEVPVELQPNGTFTGKLAFEDIQSSGYYISVKDENGTEYCESYFRIYEYEKPLYDVKVYSNEPFYTANEKIDVNLKATFYNGTPAPNLSFETASTDGSTIKTTTDISGLATVYLNQDNRSFDEHTTWDPFYNYSSFESTGMENQYIYGWGRQLVFPRDTMMQTKKVKNGLQYDINITTNKIDTSKIKVTDQIWKDYPKNITGSVANIPVDVSVYRVDRLKTFVENYYDPVNKVSVPYYSYREQKTLEKKYTVNTINGAATLTNLPNPKSSEQYYIIELSCKDTMGKTIKDSVTFGYYEDNSDIRDDLKYYSFANIKEMNKSYTGEYRYWYDNGLYGSYEIGESVDIELLDSEKQVDAKGTLLYTAVQDKIIEKGITTQSSFSFTEAEKHLPNLDIIGAYFDGKHIFPVAKCYVQFNPEARKIDIAVTPDKADYRPGDKVSLSITAKAKDGKPVKGDMVVSVVDEAIFTLAPQYTDPVGTLYTPVYDYYIESFASYVQHSFYSRGGGKGGGGGGEVRTDFKDTAIFIPTKTDENGNASVSFTLPDNLTSWRVTTVEVTDNITAGINITNINAKLPLFVSPVYNTTYIEGDDIAFSSRAYGDKVVNITPIDFTATVTGGNKVNTELKTTNTADEYAMFNFGKLTAGDYKVVFRAALGEDSDAVEYPFTVKKSGMEMQVTHEVAPNEVSSLKPIKYPVWLGFYDSQYKDFMKTLNNLSYSGGERADQKVASAIAGKLLKQYSDDKDILLPDAEGETDYTDYQQSGGGIRTYAYDSTDVQLTARTAAAAPELFNSERMIQYLNQQIAYGGAYSLTDTAAGIMGLAALKQPVLTDAKAMLKKADVLIDLDFIYLTAALAYLGDTDAAQKAYNTYIAPSMVSNEMWSYYDVTIKPRAVTDEFAGYTTDAEVQSMSGGKGGGSIYVQDALTQTGANLKRTALVMLISMKLGLPDTEKQLAYIRDNNSYDVATLLEQTAYLQNFVPTYTDTAVVAFNKGLFPTNLELKKYGIRFVAFNKSQLAKANVTVKHGNIGILASYTGVPSDLSSKASQDITIKKTITAEGGGALKAGGLARVTISVHLSENAPVGTYNISEWIPSSLRYDSAEYKSNGGIWLDAREGQRLSMCLYRSAEPVSDKGNAPKQRTDYSLTYLARCVTEGDCKIDSTYIVNRASGAVNYTAVGDVLSVKNGFYSSDTISK